MYRIAICDDDKKYISYLKTVLKDAVESNEVEFKIYEYLSGEKFQRSFDMGIYYDLLILDMQLGTIDGDEVAQSFRKKFPNSVLVFCSGVREPSIDSFKATPFRYLKKSQSYEELVKTMREIFNEVERNEQEPYIIGHHRKTDIKVKLNSIIYIENSKRGGRVIVAPRSKEAMFEDKILVDKKPRQLFDTLHEYGFALAQSSYLVNMNRIEELHVEEMIFDTGEILKISRAYQREFKHAFARRFSDKYI